MHIRKKQQHNSIHSTDQREKRKKSIDRIKYIGFCCQISRQSIKHWTSDIFLVLLEQFEIRRINKENNAIKWLHIISGWNDEFTKLLFILLKRKKTLNQKHDWKKNPRNWVCYGLWIYREREKSYSQKWRRQVRV